MQSSQTVECICQCTAARSLAGDPQSIQPENNITETIPLPWCLLTMTGWFSDTEASAVYEQYTHKRNSLFNKNSVNLLASQSATQLQIECGHQVILQPELTHTPVGTRSENLHQGGIVTPRCAIQTWGHRHIITVRRHHHRGSCCCFSLCHWCNWKYRVQSVTAENTQYNPSQLKIHSMIHQTVTVTGADENTWYDSSNSHWYTWKYTEQCVKQRPSLVQLKIHLSNSHCHCDSWKYTVQSVTQWLSLVQLKIHSTICQTATITGAAENTFIYIVQKKQLNDNKTQILLIGSAPGIDLPSSLHVGLSDIPLSNAARVIFNNQLAVGCFHRRGLKGFLIWTGLQPHSILHSLCWFARHILTL